MSIFLKKCQVFGNFLTVKWQFSGGSDVNQPGASRGWRSIPVEEILETITIDSGDVEDENGELF